MRSRGTRPVHGLILLAAVASGALCVGSAPVAQQAAPTFEVVSIRETPSSRQTTLIPLGREVQPGGRFVTPGIAVAGLILFAYDVVRPAETLWPALPDWTKNKRYAITAVSNSDEPRLPPAENHQRIRLMVREMLKERFRLQLHTETRQERVLKMSLEPGSLRLKEVEAPATPPAMGPMSMGDIGGRISGPMTMAMFVRSVSGLIRQQVIDETNLEGYYDMEFAWAAPPPPTGAPPPANSLGPEGISLFMTTMKDQFGLRFSAATGPVDYWVIDHVEPPGEN